MSGFHRRLLLAVACSLALSGVAFADLLPAEYDPAECHLWLPSQEPLGVAIVDHDCVQLPAGEFEIPRQINVPPGHQILGWDRDDTVIRAASGFTGVTAFNGTPGVRIAHLTVDMARRAVGGLGATGMTLEDVRVTGARCWGVGVAGRGMVVRDSLIEGNGVSCPVAPPGAGVYVVGEWVRDVRPVLERNVIRNNTGPGVDVNRGWGGRFRDNVVYGNSGWAAVSLYGASNWVVAGNHIGHPAGLRMHSYHRYCDPGRANRAPHGWGPAALILCHDGQTHVTVNNRITGNRLRSAYGVLSIGSDDVGLDVPWRVAAWQVPRRNVFTDNVTAGSGLGCADDLKPRQWGYARNHWRRNDCRTRYF